MHTLKPLKTFRAGTVCATVWRRGANGRVAYDVSFSCSPARDGARTPGSFSHRHIDSLVDVAIEAQVWIKENSRGPAVRCEEQQTPADEDQ